MFSIPAEMTGSGEISSELVELKANHPQQYGYLKQYWEDAQQGLKNTSRNYARVTHIYENIPDPAVGPVVLDRRLSSSPSWAC